MRDQAIQQWRPYVDFLRGKGAKYAFDILETLALEAPLTYVEIAEKLEPDSRSFPTTVYKQLHQSLVPQRIVREEDKIEQKGQSVQRYALTFRGLKIISVISTKVKNLLPNVWTVYGRLQDYNKDPKYGLPFLWVANYLSGKGFSPQGVAVIVLAPYRSELRAGLYSGVSKDRDEFIEEYSQSQFRELSRLSRGDHGDEIKRWINMQGTDPELKAFHRELLARFEAERPGTRDSLRRSNQLMSDLLT